MMRMVKFTGMALVAVLAAGVQAEEVKSKWSGDSELGYVKKSGNTESETLTAKQSIVYDSKPWRNTLTLSASNTSTDNERTGEKYYITEQLDRFISERAYGFLRGTWEKDRYSGFENQSTYLLGYGHTVVDTDAVNMKLEIGYGESIDEVDATSVTTEEGMAYLSEELKWTISDVAKLGQKISIEDTDDNRITRFNIFLQSTLMKDLATRISYDIKNVDEVPEGQKHTDKEMTVSLVYSF